MSKWLGFVVGLAISVTVVMTVLRPSEIADSETHQAVELPLRAEAPAELAPAAAEPPVTRREPSTADDASEPREDAPEGAPENETSAPEADEMPGEEIDPYATGETRVADAPAEIPEPIAEPIPEFRWGQSPSASAEVDVLPLPDPQVTVIEGSVSAADHTVPATVGDAAPSVAASGAVAEVSESGVGSTESGVRAAADAPFSVDASAASTRVGPESRQWYAFWQPFGSELSAKGFSARLERITGLDYRVVKVDSGEYHVAFGYDDEESRLANLSTIEAATGLRLGGQSL